MTPHGDRTHKNIGSHTPCVSVSTSQLVDQKPLLCDGFVSCFGSKTSVSGFYQYVMLAYLHSVIVR